MKESIKIMQERRNFRRSRFGGTDKVFLERIERIIEDRLTDLFQAFLFANDKRIGAVLDRISDLEAMQMDLVKIASGITQKLFPDYVPASREQASRGYHEMHVN